MHEEFQSTSISYRCPECKIKAKYQLNFLSDQTKTIQYTKGHWCRCGAIHQIKYTTILQKGKVVLKVSEFSSNDEIIKNKRFQIETM